METKKNITQEQMAEFMGVSQQYINLLIKNKVVPRLQRLKRFSQRTNTDIAFWLISTGQEKEKAIKAALCSKDTNSGPQGHPKQIAEACGEGI